MNHHVGSISVDLKVDNISQARFLQQSLSRLIDNELKPKLEIIFDRSDHKQQLVTIDQITIHLGRISPKNLQKEFVDKVILEIEHTLEKVLMAPSAATLAFEINREEATIEAFLIFIESGLMPEQLQEIFRKSSISEILDILLGDKEACEKITDLILWKPKAKQRILLQFGAVFYQEITHQRISSKDKASRTLKKRKAIPEGKIPLKEERTSDYKAQKLGSVAPPENLLETVAPQQHSFKKQASQGLFVQNAGLIVLHPCLAGNNEEGYSLFEEIGLLKKGVFIDENAQYKALHILQYLVWGKEQRYEFEMTLDKIICGIPIKTPVNRFVPLNDGDKEICENVAVKLTKRWKGLEGTSLQGLRTSFFQRLGKLEERSVGWKLTIEKQTIDIVLNRYPYGLGVVKLPWMEQMLWIGWDY